MVLYCTCPCSVFKFLVSVYMLWCFLFISEAATPLFYTCPDTITFNPNSTFEANLNTLLSTLSSDKTRNDMFYNATAGNSASERAYGLFMCRGDVSVNTCHECVVDATREIKQKCPRQKESYIWYDVCMLRYNNEYFFSTMEEDPSVELLNGVNSTEPDRLMQVLGKAMDDLVTRASSNRSVNGFAASRTIFMNETLYSLVQCTPDLSEADCERCFQVAIVHWRACCSGQKGARVLLPSCNIRYEMYPFYDTVAVQLQRPPPAPAPPAGDIQPPAAPPTTTPPGSSTSTPRGNGSISRQVIVGIVVAVVVAVLLTLGFCFRIRIAKKYNAIKVETGSISDIDGTEIPTFEFLQYDLNTIGMATNNFSAGNKVGTGGFGDVFKGIFSNGQEVAVKRLSKSSSQGAEQFKSEVLLVSKLQHRNLVRLVGFCLEREEKIIIYEYMPNKSLDNFLFDPHKQQLLEWSTRYKIIKGIALGILYLHEDSSLRIIHRDLKASNILLDGNMNPKVSDFGMARIFGEDQYQEITNRVVGTFGYMSLEYVRQGKFSVKSDVFSFGVIILEIISGKKNNNFNQSGGTEDLLSHAWKLWTDGTPLDLVDLVLGDSFNRNEVIRCIHIGLLCVQEDPEERPSMAFVILMLNSYTCTFALPNRPTFIFHSSRTNAMVTQLVSDESSGKAIPWSANEEPITELYPR